MKRPAFLNDTRVRKYRHFLIGAAAAFALLPMGASASGTSHTLFASVRAQAWVPTIHARNTGFPLAPLTPTQLSDAAAQGLPARGPVLAPQSSAPNAVLLWDEINVLKSASQDGTTGSVTLNIVH